MDTRDLLLLIGFLRGGRMFPVAAPVAGLPASRSLRILFAFIAEEERRLFGSEAGGAALPSPPSTDGGPPSSERDELRVRTTR